MLLVDFTGVRGSLLEATFILHDLFGFFRCTMLAMYFLPLNSNRVSNVESGSSGTARLLPLHRNVSNNGDDPWPK